MRTCFGFRTPLGVMICRLPDRHHAGPSRLGRPSHFVFLVPSSSNSSATMHGKLYMARVIFLEFIPVRIPAYVGASVRDCSKHQRSPGSLQRGASGDLSLPFGRKGNGGRNSVDCRRSTRGRTVYCRTMNRIACSANSFHPLRKENFMNDTERTAVFFLAGLGIGVGVAPLFAPRSVRRRESGLPIRRNVNLERCGAAY
jgi:hypothetical protein